MDILRNAFSLKMIFYIFRSIIAFQRYLSIFGTKIERIALVPNWNEFLESIYFFLPMIHSVPYSVSQYLCKKAKYSQNL